MKKLLTQFAMVSMALIFTTDLLKADDSGWTTDYPKALARAKAEKKLVLLDFNGSDWCMWCIRLKKEVFSQPKFKEYAEKHLVLVDVDFPMDKPLPDALKKQNTELQEKFDQEEIFPTIVLLNGDGKKVGELSYVPGGPDAWLAKLEEALKG